MEHTYSYLKTVFQNLKLETKQNPSFLFIVLVLLCIPLSYAMNSIALGTLVLVTLFTFKKSNFKTDTSLLLPVALFLMMALSLFWSIDFSSSFKALSKGLPFLFFPLCFAMLPAISQQQRLKIISLFSYGMVGFTVFYLCKALLRYTLNHDTSVFFYHELVTEDVNAIHVSVYVAVALFYFIAKANKKQSDKGIIVLLSLFLILLSSKNIIIVFLGVLVCYYWSNYQSNTKAKLGILAIVMVLLGIIAVTGKIKDRFLIEYQSNVTENSVNSSIGSPTSKVYNVSIKKAWTQDHFQKNDFFPGTAFRVYQARIFKEMLVEQPLFLTGFGLNASDAKIIEKGKQHGVYEGYWLKNFHNEYIQTFAELGIGGLLLLLAMVFLNLKNAIKTKDLMHISFAVLMISLFLTESFLSRQRGIVFFTLLFCLFNGKTAEKTPQNNT